MWVQFELCVCGLAAESDQACKPETIEEPRSSQTQTGSQPSNSYHTASLHQPVLFFFSLCLLTFPPSVFVWYSAGLRGDALSIITPNHFLHSRSLWLTLGPIEIMQATGQLWAWTTWLGFTELDLIWPGSVEAWGRNKWKLNGWTVWSDYKQSQSTET